MNSRPVRVFALVALVAAFCAVPHVPMLPAAPPASIPSVLPPGDIGRSMQLLSLISESNDRIHRLEKQVVYLAKAPRLDADPTPAPSTPTVTLPEKKQARPNLPFILRAGGNCKGIRWKIPDGLERLDPDLYPALKDPFAIGLVGSEGVYEIKCWGAIGDQPSDIATCVVTIGSPPPPGPTPPGPTPPGPTPGPAPIPTPGLRVLVIFDDATTASLSAGQFDILYGQANRDFLNSKTVVGADGKTHEFRIWPKNVVPAGETDLWQNAFKRGQKSYPWLLISNGSAGYEGPLPNSVADFQALVNKFAASTTTRKAA